MQEMTHQPIDRDRTRASRTLPDVRRSAAIRMSRYRSEVLTPALHLSLAAPPPSCTFGRLANG
jgi:hypothetical protein